MGVGAVEEPGLLAQAIVLLAEGGRQVDDPRAVVGRDVVARKDRELRLGRVAAREDRSAVEAPDELRSLERPDHLRALAEDPPDERLRDDQRLIAARTRA